MADPTLSDSTVTLDPVFEFYSKLYSRRVDVVGDYAGHELFLIEGDGLLLHCLADEHLDFYSGFQLLHATYAVESFLQGLVNRRCNFHIAFFDQHRNSCVPAWAKGINKDKFLLARSVIIRHLQVNLQRVHPGIEVHVFPSVRSTAFARYLDATDLYFVMCHDGASSQLDELSKQTTAFNALGDVEEPGKQSKTKAKAMFRLLIHWVLIHEYNVALINDLEWRDTKVITAVLESTRHTKHDELTRLLSDLDLSATPEPPFHEGLREALDKVKTNEKNSALTEREYLSLVVLSKLLREEDTSGYHASAFLRHLTLLTELPLPNRSVVSEPLLGADQEFLHKFIQEARRVLDSGAWGPRFSDFKVNHCDIADLVDGHLFSACLHDQHCGAGPRYELLRGALNALGASIKEQASNEHLGGSKHKPAPHAQPTESRPYAVLPFENDVIAKHLAPIHLAVDRFGDEPDARADKIFREVSHWHNSKRPIDPKLRDEQLARTQKQQFFARRRNQWFMAEMMAYAASLTNAVGRALEPEIVTVGPKARTPAQLPPAKKDDTVKPKPETKGAKGQAKGGKKAAVGKKEAMLAEIAASKSRKEEATSERLVQGWRATCTALEKEKESVAKFAKANQFLKTLNTPLKRETLEAEVRLFMLNTLLAIWIDCCREKTKDKNLNIAALIFDSVHSFSRLRLTVTKTIANCLKTAVELLGLPPLDIPAPEGDRPLAFRFVLQNLASLDLRVRLPSKDFQLAYCGPYFDRTIDSAPDPRVPFEPDAWQRKVLDEIDARRSLLVIAPTSAGKTFISFYAMEQVLRTNNEDVLVYVAPTKALVNQIAAEIQARYSKTYQYAGNSVWAIHTRDYRINNPIGCQILVTVPHILQIMLLAPSNAKSWSERVKWIIFDEVHCISQAEDGLIWEQLLLLAPCPIIALSATIGNPQEFSDWLASTQKAIGNDLKMITHPHRYSDLRKFLYTPPRSFHFKGMSEKRAFAQLGLDGCNDFTFVHPVASLIHRARGMPDDFSLEAHDCFTLWQSMTKHQTREYPVDKALDPANALPELIRKIDVINWENKLKALLRRWLADSQSPFEAVFNDLNRELVEREAGKGKKPDEDGVEDVDVDEHNPEDILPLLSTLHEQDALPGIVFNYERGMCERMCRVLLGQLVSAETRWKETSPKWKSMLQSWDAWKKAMTKAEKRRPQKISKKGKDEEVISKADLLQDNADSEASPWASFNPDDPVEGFHFADRKKLTQDDIYKYMKELIRRQVPEYLLDSLKRGIGVHHAGMNRKYRQVVEILFRKGYLRVVIATGTLALGINMPCKTVVFSGDSVFLTALNYRQAAGRAGRRGFDMLGNVVFHGISTSKVRRLLSSRLPDLNGHFPITTTLVLRLFTLLHESKNSPFAIRSINALLSQPRLYLGGEESKMTVLHHLRFSIEYLRRQYLLDARGAPLNLAGLVSHLYFAENSAFAFHALLKDGFFHELCADIEKNPTKVLQELMLTLSHLFGRIYCRRSDQEFVKEVVKKSPSIVFLPPLPSRAAEVLRSHNKNTLEVFRAYVQTFIEQHVHDPDDSLPLTGIKVGGDSFPQSAQTLQFRPPTTVRSPFVALSGATDSFESIHDLCHTARSGVFLEEAVVPYVTIYPEESSLPLNAYLYDFFNHGDVHALATANRIRSGDVWFVLNDFSLVLATIITSLSNFMNLTSASDLSFAEVRGEGDEEEERAEDRLLPEDSGYETASTASMATGRADANGSRAKVPPQVKKKKKVADSWDADADEEDFQEELLAEKKKKGGARANSERDEAPTWEEGAGLMNVLKAFKALREEFDTKFRAMWA
ncbi:DEAD/DEAH box helicase-like protein [Westerdykella ornata]|uniref:DEAD/DEAH box helicase-like protein n=1 Tax=Westerdykella ornata TaxID=318751 RepID=A0A6A6JJ16_WESOR|nr:DEAD/DEAH box helicase-like protein [Westerdykella ornata]KAF2276452.1 DEAD/DEAH box helicase-like protein [Westerdykella ornata]